MGRTPTFTAGEPLARGARGALFSCAIVALVVAWDLGPVVFALALAAGIAAAWGGGSREPGGEDRSVSQTEGEAPPEGPSFLIDSSALIDGRILELATRRLWPGRSLIPSFVLSELQALADHRDRQRRDRGRRGLEVAAAMRAALGPALVIEEADVRGAVEGGVDGQLIALASTATAALVSCDGPLIDLARARGLATLDPRELAGALQRRLRPGESLNLLIVKPGESKDQGVGYLEDGSMVVVAGGRARVGEEAEVIVDSLIKTRNGPLVFARRVAPGGLA